MALFKVISLLGALAVIALAVPVSGVEESYSHIAVAAAALPPVPALQISHAPLAIAHAPVIKEVEHHAPPQYEFRYGVKDDHTHDIKEQAEKRIGDKVEGHYSLVEPDGTTRTVKYTADHHSGFNAVVSKSGHAVHPATPSHKVVAAPVISYAHVPVTTHEAALSYDHNAELIYH